jgi:hypothetical protein
MIAKQAYCDKRSSESITTALKGKSLLIAARQYHEGTAVVEISPALPGKGIIRGQRLFMPQFTFSPQNFMLETNLGSLEQLQLHSISEVSYCLQEYTPTLHYKGHSVNGVLVK